MWKPKILESDSLQSENFVPESSPGAGDGQGWRLSKNGDVEINQTLLSQASLNRFAGISEVRKDQLTQPEMEIVIRIDMAGITGGVDNVERVAKAIKQVVLDNFGTERYRITEEVSARAEADTVLASRIGAMNSGLAHVLAGVGASIGVDVGKEYLYVKQPGGEVRIGDLSDKLASLGRLGGKPLTAEDFHLKPGNIAGEFAGGLLRDPLKGSYRDIEPTKEFLAENVRSDLTPQAACALSLMAPITSNGKAPANILPRGVDDKE